MRKSHVRMRTVSAWLQLRLPPLLRCGLGPVNFIYSFIQQIFIRAYHISDTVLDPKE